MTIGAGFTVGPGYAVYEGPSWDSGFHRHAAFQITVAVEGHAAILDEAATHHRAEALLVPPMVRHRMLTTAKLRVLYVEPHCAYADRLRRRCGPGVTAAPDLRVLGEDEIRSAGTGPSERLDPRLFAALEVLADGPVAVPELAARVGVSPQRLRGLARDQLGMPLARWRVWHQLRRTAEAVRAGRSLAEAATAGGFADQAHLTRWMRETMGLTPAAVLPLLRPSAADGGVHRDRSGDR
ncbi:AraC family transcriptional regulator [Actinomadura logoneensis]|uniref:AraC family transcriptional regulator n=1 Tax=Actinomadura logoneensis TaxID=2293572 RepID=A0A372JMX1_9ACTN|nr:AraC family transcriptional regulator [Actinomadura logoneensis]RFU41357.1 AraC family transcriptional regulator [Actinomadura logoneensis]